MPVFNDVSSMLISQRLNTRIVIVVAPAVEHIVVENLQRWENNIIVVNKDTLSNDEFQKLKRVVFASCDIALAASGTVSLELRPLKLQR